MAKRIEDKGIDAGRIAILPPWSHDDVVRYDAAGRERFRREHGLDGKFVVMYSGNHSPCHPLTTLLEAAQRLRERDRTSRSASSAEEASFRPCGDLPRAHG